MNPRPFSSKLQFSNYYKQNIYNARMKNEFVFNREKYVERDLIMIKEGIKNDRSL